MLKLSLAQKRERDGGLSFVLKIAWSPQNLGLYYFEHSLDGHKSNNEPSTEKSNKGRRIVVRAGQGSESTQARFV